MSDPRYAPPAENAETPVSPLDREIMKWEKIHALAAIPIHTAPVTAPILAIAFVFSDGFAHTSYLNRSLLVALGILLAAGWIYASHRLSKLKQEKFKSPDNWEIPQ